MDSQAIQDVDQLEAAAESAAAEAEAHAGRAGSWRTEPDAAVQARVNARLLANDARRGADWVFAFHARRSPRADKAAERAARAADRAEEACPPRAFDELLDEAQEFARGAAAESDPTPRGKLLDLSMRTLHRAAIEHGPLGTRRQRVLLQTARACGFPSYTPPSRRPAAPG